MSSPRLTRGRISEHGRIYTVTTVCHRRRPLFLDTFVVGAVTRELRRLADDGIAENHAWVLMPDHLHWLFGLRNCDLSECMQLLKGRSARSINRVLDGHGAVWQGEMTIACESTPVTSSKIQFARDWSRRLVNTRMLGARGI
jgi:putative transposase